MENHGQKIEYGEEFYTINNYNDVLFPTRIKFRQMDLAEELLNIWWLLQFTLLWYLVFMQRNIRMECPNKHKIFWLVPSKVPRCGCTCIFPLDEREDAANSVHRNGKTHKRWRGFYLLGPLHNKMHLGAPELKCFAFCATSVRLLVYLNWGIYRV